MYMYVCIRIMCMYVCVFCACKKKSMKTTHKIDVKITIISKKKKQKICFSLKLKTSQHNAQLFWRFFLGQDYKFMC